MSLYEFTDLPKADRVPLYIDTDWNTFLQVVSRNLELTRYYDLRYPMVANDLEDYDQLALLTDDPKIHGSICISRIIEKTISGPTVRFCPLIPTLSLVPITCRLCSACFSSFQIVSIIG